MSTETLATTTTRDGHQLPTLHYQFLKRTYGNEIAHLIALIEHAESRQLSQAEIELLVGARSHFHVAA